jgi:hypothetical protein
MQKIRAFSRSARVVCAGLCGIGLVATAASLLTVSFTGVPVPQRLEGTAFGVLASVLTPLQARLWWVFSQSAVMGVGLATVFQLYRLFGNLATGAVYTAENVRRVRHVGLLLLVSAVLGVVLPAATLAMANSLAAGAVTTGPGVFRCIGEALGSFVAAGLVLLASWIMDVGLYEKEHADELRRDADLMI